MTINHSQIIGGGGAAANAARVFIPSQTEEFNLDIPHALPQAVATSVDFATSGVLPFGKNGNNQVNRIDCNDFSVPSGANQLVTKPGVHLIRCTGAFTVDAASDGIMGTNGQIIKQGNGRNYGNSQKYFSNTDSNANIVVVHCNSATISNDINLSASNQADFLTIAGSTSEVGTVRTPSYNDVRHLASDGQFLFVLDQTFIVAYEINPDGTLTFAGERNESKSGKSVYYDSNVDRIFVPYGTSQVFAYEFDGSTFTTRGSCNTSGSSTNSVTGDGTFIYVVSEGTNGGLYGFTHNGSSWSASLGFQADGAPGFFDVATDGTTIFVAARTDGIAGFTFNGTTFTAAGTRDDGGDYTSVAVGGGSVYAALTSVSAKRYTHSGTTFTLVESVSGSNNETRVDYDAGLDMVHVSNGSEWIVVDQSNTRIANVTGGLSGLRGIFVSNPTHVFLAAVPGSNNRVESRSKGFNGKGGEFHVYAESTITFDAGTINTSGGDLGFKGKIVLHAPTVTTTGGTLTNTGLLGSPLGAGDDIIIKQDDPFDG